MADIFISYSREDTAFVDALILSLIEYGWTVWSDKSGMAEGRPFDQQIEDAIVQSSVALVVWSRGSVKSRWVRAEAAFALDGDKLIPILADQTDPPLQFLHIQSVSLAGWNRTTDDTAFRKLAEMLSRRLDRVGQAPPAKKNASASAQATNQKPGEAEDTWKNLRETCFPATGPGYQQFFGDRTFFITRFYAVFGFCAVILFGLIDVIEKSDSAVQTQYRFMVTGPLMLLLLGLGFTPFAKRFSQSFAFACACVTLLTNIRTITMSNEHFPVATGAATTSFMAILGICMILPLRVGYAAAFGVSVLLVHEMYIRQMSASLSSGLHAGYTISVLILGLVTVALAYFRDRVMRMVFRENSQLSGRNVELKDRVMTLASQRGKPADAA